MMSDLETLALVSFDTNPISTLMGEHYFNGLLALKPCEVVKEAIRAYGDDIIPRDDPMLRRLFEHTAPIAEAQLISDGVGVPLSTEELSFYNRPFFEQPKYNNTYDSIYNLEPAEDLTLLEQLEQSETTEALEDAIRNCDHERYNDDDPINQIPEFYRRNIRKVGDMIAMHSSIELYSVTEHEVGKRVLSAYMMTSHNDLFNFIRRDNKALINRSIDFGEKREWIRVGDVEYPRKAFYRFFRSTKQAFQLTNMGKRPSPLIVKYRPNVFVAVTGRFYEGDAA